MPSIVFGYAWISCHKGGRRRPGRYPRLPVDNIRRRSVGFPTSMELSNDAARTGPPRRRKDETLRYASIYMLISLSGVSGAAMPVRQHHCQRSATRLQKGKMPYSFPTKRRCRILAYEPVKKSDLSGVAPPVLREIVPGPPRPSPRTCLPRASGGPGAHVVIGDPDRLRLRRLFEGRWGRQPWPGVPELDPRSSPWGRYSSVFVPFRHEKCPIRFLYALTCGDCITHQDRQTPAAADPGVLKAATVPVPGSAGGLWRRCRQHPQPGYGQSSRASTITRLRPRRTR